MYVYGICPTDLLLCQRGVFLMIYVGSCCVCSLTLLRHNKEHVYCYLVLVNQFNAILMIMTLFILMLKNTNAIPFTEREGLTKVHTLHAIEYDLNHRFCKSPIILFQQPPLNCSRDLFSSCSESSNFGNILHTTFQTQ